MSLAAYFDDLHARGLSIKIDGDIQSAASVGAVEPVADPAVLQKLTRAAIREAKRARLWRIIGISLVVASASLMGACLIGIQQMWSGSR